MNLKRCIESISNSSYHPFEIIVCDNNLKNEGYGSLYRSFETRFQFKIIRNFSNVGHAKGINIALGEANGKYVAKLDDDTVVDPMWLTELVRIMESDRDIGIAQSRIIQMEGHGRIQSVGSFLDPLGYDHVKQITGGHPEMIFYAGGAAFIIKKDIIDKISINGEFFDSDYFVYYDEVDVCWRALLAGWKIVSVPTSVVFHRTKRVLQPHFIYFQARNRIMTLVKNYALPNLFKYLPLLILLEILRMLVLLIVDSSHSLAIIRAFLWNVRNFRGNLVKRGFVQQMVRRMPDSYIMGFMTRPSVRHLYDAFKALYQI